ncbi:hypothetical protein MNBD_ALPHA08-2245 [hydrothermal vent metagenome]|uniref:Murein endopeptidase K n=1 Tax=hydrothermal vent metagenome TaxID=652676 RepID=A0A3B0RW81_9ZZZZ
MISRFFKKSLFAVFVTAFLAASLSTGARAEIRTLSLYSIHNKESLTVTYKKDGRYIPSAMQKLNRFFRDWRNDKETRMDPVTIDLLWELYQDLGAKKPARVISAHRSAATNAMLRRIGRKVARRSMHITGKAIDVSFPDVPLSRLRGSALARRIGGVGYYPRSGFVHIDSGTVRNWPRISPLRLASIIKKNRSTIGARFGRRSAPTTLVASATKRPSTGPVNIIPRSFRQKPVARIARIPVPRPRPLEVAMAAAAADTFILPAAAPAGKQNFNPRRSLVGNSIGTLLASTNLENNSTVVVQRTNKAGKSSFVGMIRAGTATGVPLLKPMQTTYAANEFWWSGDMNKLIRRDGAPRPFLLGNEAEAATSESVLTGADKSALETMIAALTGKTPPVAASRVVRSDKGDSLIVNRAAKSDMFSTRPTNRNWRKARKASDKLVGNFEAILKSADQPIGFAQ